VPCELLLLGYIILQITRRKKWDPERMKAANEAIRNKEIGSCTASRVFTLPRTTPQNYVKDQKSSGEAIKTG
jgi:hypothetical protein